jgi:flagellar hook-basal body complex protein FliE
MITALSVARAYASVQKAAGLDAGAPAAGPAASAGAGFADMVKNAMGETVKASRHAEAQMIAQVQGKADLVDVATALQAAQTSLQTVMAVRDQVISAYKEIMQMPI